MGLYSMYCKLCGAWMGNISPIPTDGSEKRKEVDNLICERCYDDVSEPKSSITSKDMERLGTIEPKPFED